MKILSIKTFFIAFALFCGGHFIYTGQYPEPIDYNDPGRFILHELINLIGGITIIALLFMVVIGLCLCFGTLVRICRIWARYR